ncbi:DUF2921 family protein [Dictyobacter kobayashii]|nr:DUF2921 family protein [Dictyobacter kobayashii]
MAQGWSASNSITRLSMGQGQQSEIAFGTPPDVASLLANVVYIQQRFGL